MYIYIYHTYYIYTYYIYIYVHIIYIHIIHTKPTIFIPSIASDIPSFKECPGEASQRRALPVLRPRLGLPRLGHRWPHRAAVGGGAGTQGAEVVAPGPGKVWTKCWEYDGFYIMVYIYNGLYMVLTQYVGLCRFYNGFVMALWWLYDGFYSGWLVVSKQEFYFPSYGMSSFPLNSYFPRWLKPPTRWVYAGFIMGLYHIIS